MMCSDRTRAGHGEALLWAGVPGHGASALAAWPARIRHLTWGADQRRLLGPIDAMVPRTEVIELDEGTELHGRPDWPGWMDERLGRAPMWVADSVDATTAERLAAQFPTTGLWPVRLLEDAGERWALVPAQRPADIPAQLCWRIPGRGRETGVSLSALLRSWEERIGAQLVAIGADTVVLDVQRGHGTNWVLCWDGTGQPSRNVL